MLPVRSQFLDVPDHFFSRHRGSGIYLSNSFLPCCKQFDVRSANIYHKNLHPISPFTCSSITSRWHCVNSRTGKPEMDYLQRHLPTDEFILQNNCEAKVHLVRQQAC